LPFTSLRLTKARTPSLPRGYPQNPRSVGEHLRKVRLDRGLPQRTVAEALGVRVETVRMWEAGRARPLPRHHSRLVRFLGDDPEPAGSGRGERIRARRRRLGLTQAELAAALGIDEGTVNDLERGHRRVSRRILALAEGFLAGTDRLR
jgi:transcriptional regulator with XRE-family HTH domain